MSHALPLRERLQRWLHTPRSIIVTSALVFTVTIYAGMALTYHIFLNQVQRPRIERVATSIAAYIQAVRQFAHSATPEQRAAFLGTLVSWDSSGVRVVDRAAAKFQSPRGPLLPEFLARVQAATPGGQVAWHDGGDQDQTLWFEVPLPDAAPLWLSYPAQASPISPYAVAAIFGALFVLAIGAAALLQARLQPPIQALGEAVGRLARGERRVELRPAGTTELAVLSGRFNRMAQSLDEAHHERALLLAGISHDLRTPLTKLRIGLALRDNVPGDEHLVRAINEIDAIIDQFVEFARAGSNTDNTDAVVRLDLNDIVRESAATLELDAHPFELDLQALPPVCVRPVSIQRVLANLMGNAVRYAGVGLAVSTRLAGGLVCLRVSDAGPGVSADELQRLGQPFVRTDAGRAKGPGSGLGLAIVQRLLQAEGGTLTLALNHRGGLDALVRLPPAPTG